MQFTDIFMLKSAVHLGKGILLQKAASEVNPLIIPYMAT